MINLSPSALKTWLACRRRWYLEFVARAERVVPAYVSAGTALDAVVQGYLHGNTPLLAAGSPELAELNALLPELPAPNSVLVQERFRLPCPGLEGRVHITTGGLDYMTPPNLDLMVIGDLKRIWHKDAAMTPKQLADDVQAQMYAWLVWQVYSPAEIIWRWTYCVRETRNATTGAVTRKAKAFSVDVKADRARVEAWFDRVVLPAARAMLEIRDAARAAEAVEHDPTSCEEGARCFVRHHCPMYQGPVKGDNNMVDLSRFKTGARPAINPPAPSALELPQVVTEPVLSVTTIEGPGAALLEAVEEESNAERATEPAPPPALLTLPSADVQPYTEAEAEAIFRRDRNAAKSRKRRGRAEKQAIEAHEAEVVAPLSVESATTEALVWELRDRGYLVKLEAGAL